ncbi:hypothetical protein ACFX15_019256 [Malus domestica]
MAEDVSGGNCLQTELADGLANGEGNHGGLAGIGLGLGYDVATLNNGLDGSLLDGGEGGVEVRTKESTATATATAPRSQAQHRLITLLRTSI